MSKPITVPNAALAKRIVKQRERIETLAKNTAEAIFQLGAMLTEARNKTTHGQWETWVSSNCGFTGRNALNYIKAYQYIQGLGEENRKSISDLPLTGILELANEKSPIRRKIEAEQQSEYEKRRDEVDQKNKTAFFEKVTAQKAGGHQDFTGYNYIDPDREWHKKLVQDENEQGEPPPPKVGKAEEEITDAEFREVETVAKPIKPQPEQVQDKASIEHETSKPLATPKDLLREAYRIINGLNNGKKPDRVEVFAWVAAYDSLKVNNQLAADRDDDLAI